MTHMLAKLFLFLICVTACHAQTALPEAPSSVRAWAVNIGTNSKYSVTKGTWDTVPKIVLDYRFTSRFRTGLEYSHSVETRDNSLAIVVNYKLAEWGRKR